MRWFAMMIVFACAVAHADPKEVTVSIKEVQIKQNADHLSKNLEIVVYGDKLKIVEKQNAWYKVTTDSGKTGWVHQSSVTTKKIKLAKDAKVGDGSASNDEVALAGKGFSKQVEQAYSKDNPQIAKAFKQVDQIEAFKLPQPVVRAFIQQGKLK